MDLIGLAEMERSCDRMVEVRTLETDKEICLELDEKELRSLDI
jgi:hypothetical protein